MGQDIPCFGERVEGEEYCARPGAYAVGVRGDGLVAVVRIPRGYFLPGGGVEGDEGAEEALVREVREECGCGVRILGEVGVAMQFVGAPGEGYFAKRSTFFRAAFEGEVEAAAEADHELVWLTAEEAMGKLNHGSQRWAVGQAVGRGE